MPILKNPRHEAVAQLVAAGKPVSRAYAMAGYCPDRSNARRLTTYDHVAQRINALRQENEAMAKLSRETIIANEQEIFAAAKHKGNLGQASTSNMNLAKLGGYLVDKHEVTQKEAVADFSVLTPDELDVWNRGSAMLAPLVAKVFGQSVDDGDVGNGVGTA
jgi:hypothetical protein